MRKSGYLLVMSLLSGVSKSYAAEPALTIKNDAEERVYTRSELLKRKDLVRLKVPRDPAYPGKQMTYRAVRAASLFKGLKISTDSVIQFKALDGFSAPVSAVRLLNESEKESVAYIATEPEHDKWPPLKGKKSSAGPFYLVWKNPELSNISPEEWPFMLAAFQVKGTLNQLYPAIFPSASESKTSDIYRGFDVFKKNCFACHTMNKMGSSEIGPDLNTPQNPTGYFTEKALRQLIRDPQSVRYWPQARMNGFSKDVISDTELSQLMEYLRHMRTKS